MHLLSSLIDAGNMNNTLCWHVHCELLCISLNDMQAILTTVPVYKRLIRNAAVCRNMPMSKKLLNINILISMYVTNLICIAEITPLLQQQNAHHMWFQMGTTSPNDTPPPPINILFALTSLNKNSYEIFTIFYPSKGISKLKKYR